MNFVIFYFYKLLLNSFYTHDRKQNEIYLEKTVLRQKNFLVFGQTKLFLTTNYEISIKYMKILPTKFFELFC